MVVRRMVVPRMVVRGIELLVADRPVIMHHRALPGSRRAHCGDRAEAADRQWCRRSPFGMPRLGPGDPRSDHAIKYGPDIHRRGVRQENPRAPPISVRSARGWPTRNGKNRPPGGRRRAGRGGPGGARRTARRPIRAELDSAHLGDKMRLVSPSRRCSDRAHPPLAGATLVLEEPAERCPDASSPPCLLPLGDENTVERDELPAVFHRPSTSVGHDDGSRVGRDQLQS